MLTKLPATAPVRPVRLLHTSDWHLGHELFGHTREVEHDAFLAWLSDTLEQQQADALLVTGDIYDVANPSVPAQQRLYRFIAQLRQRLPRLQIIIIGGNHDSALRIDLPGALVDADVHLIGGLPRQERTPDMERICIALKNADGVTAAWLGAVPFCRPSDLEADGLAGLYARITTALADKADGLPIVLSGHLHVGGGEVSELSERRLVIGGEEAAATDLFDSRAAYVALGHLHRPQTLKAAVPIRYAGSPFPLSAAERAYQHAVTLAVLEPTGAQLETLLIPRPVAFLRVPEHGALPPDKVVEAVQALDLPDLPRARQPFLEIAVQVDGPEPQLQARLLAALENKPVRLTRIRRVAPQSGHSAPVIDPARDLSDLREEDIFIAIHQHKYHSAPSDTLSRAFAELVAEALRENDDTGADEKN
jgi:exonuclease SbcD